MHFEKQLPGDLSPLSFSAYRDARTISRSPRLSLSNTGPAFAGWTGALRPHVQSFQQIDLRRGEGYRTSEGAPIRTRPEQDASWRPIPTAIFGIGVRVIEGFAATGEIVFSGVLLAFMSWTMAEVLAGCAAYAQAMYPCHVGDETGGQADRGGPADAEHFPPSPSHQTAATVTVSVAVESIAHPEPPGVGLPGWSASISLLAAKLWSRVRRESDRRRAMAKLRSLDDRVLRDIGICRCDIECFTRDGERCE